MLSFTGSAIVSMVSTVTMRSRSPLSATTNAVSNFSVLAGGRNWSGFFSYNTSPLWAFTTMTELAEVAGTVFGTPGTNGGSGDSLGFVAVRCLRLEVCRCGATPVGVTASSSCAGVVATIAQNASAAKTIEA